MTQCQIPCDDSYRDKLKIIACFKRKKMKAVLHEWITENWKPEYDKELEKK